MSENYSHWLSLKPHVGSIWICGRNSVIWRRRQYVSEDSCLGSTHPHGPTWRWNDAVAGIVLLRVVVHRWDGAVFAPTVMSIARYPRYSEPNDDRDPNNERTTAVVALTEFDVDQREKPRKNGYAQSDAHQYKPKSILKRPSVCTIR